MKSGWSEVCIREICNLMTGGTPSRDKKEYFENGKIKWLVSGDIHSREITDCEGRITEAGLKNSNAKLLPINSVMIALNGQGKTRGTVALLRTQATCNQSLVSIYPKNPSQLLPEFLYFNLFSRYEELRKMTGDAGNERRGLNMMLIGDIKIPLPPLAEQQRIVALLDQAFAGIAAAKTNAEKNLQNTKDLYSFYIDQVFSNTGESWKVIPLGEACTLQRGFDLPKRLRISGDYPLVSSSGVSDYIDDFKVTSPGVVTGRSGSIGNVFFIETDFWPLNTVLYVKDFHGNYEQFIYYLLSHFGLNKYSTGAGVPTLNRNFVHEELVSIPGSFQEQVEVVARMDNLFNQCKKLEATYYQKAIELDELKKSILQKAFNGELTEG